MKQPRLCPNGHVVTVAVSASGRERCPDCDEFMPPEVVVAGAGTPNGSLAVGARHQNPEPLQVGDPV